MKAKLTTGWDVTRYRNQTALSKGTEVSIVPHMEADAETVLNRPEGMCYLCKLDNGTCSYIPAVYLEITDWDNVDWEQRRYEIAKDMLAAIESNSNPQMFVGNPDEQVKWAIIFADELIKQLKGE